MSLFLCFTPINFLRAKLVYRPFTLVISLLVYGLLTTISAPADELNGAWGPIIEWPHIPVSAANLPDGRILTWSGSERRTWPTTEQTYSATWDPQTGEFVEIFHDGHNMFCAHLAMTENGEVFVNGGRNQTNSPWTSLFDYRDNQWTQIENMATGGRWYAVTLALPSGEIMTNMGTASNFRNPEKWSPARSWEVLNGIDYNAMRTGREGTSGGRRWWANLSVTPLGEIFHYWDSDENHLIDPSGVGSFRDANAVTDNTEHAPGVSIQFADGMVLVAGANQGSWNSASQSRAFVIDLNGTPTITTTGSMAFPRAFANLVTLPNGEVLAIGGNTSGQAFSDNGTVYEAEIWNPDTGTWRVVAAMDVPRNYHSIALLMADGTVLAGGGGYSGGDPDLPASHQDGQVFTPPYLFAPGGGLAARPAITSGPGEFTHGDDLLVMATANLARFTMVRMASTTHAVNTDARFHEISFVENSPGQYTLSPSANPNLLLPGYWMLFAIDAAGVPSVADIIRVQRYVVPEPWRYVRLTALSEASGGASASIAEFGVFDESGTPIPRSGWSASANSEAPGAEASQAIDGDPGTSWQSAANGPSHPHDLIVDLGVGHRISGISYHPREDSDEGHVANYEVRLSTDGNNWSGVFASGIFENVTGGGAGTPPFDPILVNFQPSGSAVPSGYIVDAGNTYGNRGAGLNYGWSSNVTNDSRDRGNHADQRYDTLLHLQKGSSSYWEIEVPNGSYSVDIVFGDPSHTDQVNNMQLENVTLLDPDGEDNFDEHLGIVVSVTDGRLTVSPLANADNAKIAFIDIRLEEDTGGQVEEIFFDESFPLSEVEIAASPATATSTELTYTASVGLNLEYQWSFGDGTPATDFSSDPTASHSFTAPGRFNVVVTVRDQLTGEEQSINVTQIIYDATIDPSDDGMRRLSSSSVVFHPSRDEIWNVNPDNATATVIGATSLTKLAEIAVGAEPRSLAVAADGRVWVVAKQASEINVINPLTRTVDAVIPLGNGGRASSPHGIVFSPSANLAYVALEDSGEVLEIDASTLGILRRVSVGDTPRHLGISRDGLTLYISRFITPPVPGEDGALPDPTLGGGELITLNSNDFSTLSVISLNYSDEPTTENTGPGLPNYLGAAAMSPDPTIAYVPSKQDNILGGTQRLGDDLDFDHTVRAISSRIDLASATESTIERIDHDNSSIASHAVFGPFGLHLFTALEGNRAIAISDTLVDSEIARFDVGRAPQGLALSANGMRLAVHNFMDRSVEVIDISAVVNFGGVAVTSIGTVQTVATELLTAPVLLGKQHFYDAKDDRLAALDYLACAACHNAAGGDGRTWDFSQFGEGMRTTISLEGHGQQHGPLHWTANFDEVQDFEGQIRNFALGAGLMSDADFQAGTRSDPLGDPKAGLSPDLDALAAYVQSLTSVGVSPFRDGGGELSTEALAGRALVEANGCLVCHAGASFTDSDSLALHDVGTLVAPESGPQMALDTPTLLGLWATAPYLHNGSAATLQEAVVAHTLLGLSLSAGELDVIAAYLLEIDDIESSLWTPPDSDDDGVHDGIDAFPFDPTEWADTDGDNVGDNSDVFPLDPTEWADTDADGVGDNADAFPNDGTETADSDGDGLGDNADSFPNDPSETLDTDSDGVGDNGDLFPNDPSEWADSDGDGVGDNADVFPNDPSETVDTDGDGVGDNGDLFPDDGGEWADRDGDGIGDNSDPYPDDPTNTPPNTVGKLHHGTMQNVGSSWLPVTLPAHYTDMVVVASVAYLGSDLPAVTRVRNAFGNGFELKVQNPSGTTLNSYTVTYLVAEAGQYTQAGDGVSFEAVKILSTVTDEDSSWVGQPQTYSNSYSNPVVVGQVMTENDPRWSVFWASDGSTGNPPSAAGLAVGKHVAEDPDTTRADETIGYLVFETTNANVGSLVIEAGLTADTVEGIAEAGAPWIFPVSSTTGTPVVSSAGMDGTNGGWVALYGANALSGSGLSVAVDEDQLLDAERDRTTDQVAYVIVSEYVEPTPSVGPKFQRGVAATVDDNWQEILLPETYDEMVVIATPLYDPTASPRVARVRAAVGNRFELRIQNPSGNAAPATEVHWIVAEAGVYTEAADGITLEARIVNSSLTDSKSVGWTAEPQTYMQSYNNPIVLGQVMTANDPDWSVFWASSGSRTTPPNNGAIWIGKHVAEDTDTTRANESIGYLVVESGTAVVGSLTIEAGVSADTIRGAGNSPPYSTPTTLADGTVVLSATGMDGGDGGWLVHQQTPGANTLQLFFDEDQISNSERSHTTEQAAYLLIRE